MNNGNYDWRITTLKAGEAGFFAALGAIAAYLAASPAQHDTWIILAVGILTAVSNWWTQWTQRQANQN